MTLSAIIAPAAASAALPPRAEDFNTSGYGTGTTSRNDAGFALGVPADLIYTTHVLLLVENKICRAQYRLARTVCRV